MWVLLQLFFFCFVPSSLYSAFIRFLSVAESQRNPDNSPLRGSRGSSRVPAQALAAAMCMVRARDLHAVKQEANSTSIFANACIIHVASFVVVKNC